MAAYYLFMKNPREFYHKLKERDPDMITKMVKSTLHAIKNKKPKIDLFEINFKDTTTLTFTLEKDQYLDVIKNCLDDMIKIENYELCAQMRDVINKPSRRKKSELSK
jgi:protein-arginine kinase activator protein McsA